MLFRAFCTLWALACRAIPYSPGERYDLIFDAVGKRKSSNLQCKNALAPDGQFISVDDGSPKLHVEGLIRLRELIETRKITPVIDRCFPLEEMVEAHRYVDKGHKKGNVIITVGHGEKS
jgi:NADPH:quinone reductase-like Zn-dependent oxidoreductase